MLLQQARDVALGRIGVQAEQQVRGREMEEGQRMRLHELRAVEQFAQLLGGRRDAHGHDCVARLRRGKLVADRANAADARCDRRHLVVGPTLDELLEPTDLGHVELRVGHLPRVVELDRDLGVTLDPRHVVDGDRSHGWSPGLGRARSRRVGFRRHCGHKSHGLFTQLRRRRFSGRHGPPTRTGAWSRDPAFGLRAAHQRQTGSRRASAGSRGRGRRP